MDELHLNKEQAEQGVAMLCAMLKRGRAVTCGKKYHKAVSIRANGSVSALCFKKKRAIDLTRALWTTDDAYVTCPKCLKELS